MDAEFTNRTNRLRKSGEGSVGSASLPGNTKKQKNSVKFGVPPESHQRIRIRRRTIRAVFVFFPRRVKRDAVWRELFLCSGSLTSQPRFVSQLILEHTPNLSGEFHRETLLRQAAAMTVGWRGRRGRHLPLLVWSTAVILFNYYLPELDVFYPFVNKI